MNRHINTNELAYIQYEIELIVVTNNVDSHENPYKENKQNISVIPQPERNKPENELMAYRDSCTNN